MVWFIITLILSAILDIITVSRQSNLEKDLEVLVLRQQLSILQRKLNSPIKPRRVEKLSLAVLTNKIKHISNKSTNQLRDVIRIFQPDTIIRWHHELVRKKWTYPTINTGGRPSISKELKNIILRLDHENPRWGYGKIQGELSKHLSPTLVNDWNNPSKKNPWWDHQQLLSIPISHYSIFHLSSHFLKNSSS